jgi:hypothetical protein
VIHSTTEEALVPTKHTTFRLEDSTLAELAALSEALQVPRTEVVRQGITAFRDLILVAQADAAGVLATLRDLYGADAQVMVTVEVTNAEPKAHVSVNGADAPDLEALAIKSPDGERVFLFLDPIGVHATVLVTVGNDALAVRPRFAIGDLPWPPRGRAIALSLKDLEPAVSADTSKLEKVEA